MCDVEWWSEDGQINVDLNNAYLETGGYKVHRNSVCLQKIHEDRCVRIRERGNVSGSENV